MIEEYEFLLYFNVYKKCVDCYLKKSLFFFYSSSKAKMPLVFYVAYNMDENISDKACPKGFMAA